MTAGFRLDLTDQDILGYHLNLLTDACPEQYEIYKDGQKVAYLRLRHGVFQAFVPDYGTTVVYKSMTEGDGQFTDEERIPELTNAVKQYRNI